MGGIIQRVEDACTRFRSNAGAEDSDILTNLPSYARLLSLCVAHRAVVASRSEGDQIPDSASRLLLLWPERAADCWDKHMRWAQTQGPAVAAHLTKPWTWDI
jgi:hypothetical protein